MLGEALKITLDDGILYKLNKNTFEHAGQIKKI